MEDSLFRLADRLADNPSLAISSSLYDSDNERRTAILEDMADFFTYLIYVMSHTDAISLAVTLDLLLIILKKCHPSICSSFRSCFCSYTKTSLV